MFVVRLSFLITLACMFSQQNNGSVARREEQPRCYLSLPLEAVLLKELVSVFGSWPITSPGSPDMLLQVFAAAIS